MDRRSFLTLLGASALSVVVSELWTPPSVLLPEMESLKTLCSVSAPADRIVDIIICGKNNCSQVATFDVIRPNGTKVLALALNTFGGIIRWVAAPGQELLAPLQFVYSHSNMTVNVVGMRGDQMSYTVLEPGQDIAALIPMRPTWRVEPLPVQHVPEVFQNAWHLDASR